MGLHQIVGCSTGPRYSLLHFDLLKNPSAYLSARISAAFSNVAFMPYGAYILILILIKRTLS